MDIRNPCFRIYAPIVSNSPANSSRHGNVQTGCEANGMRSDVILKKRRPCCTLKARIFFKAGQVSGNGLPHPHFIIGHEAEGAGCRAAN